MAVNETLTDIHSDMGVTSPMIGNPEEPTISKKDTPTCIWRVMAWTVTVITVLLLVAVLSTTIYWKVKRHNDLGPREQTLCVPCNDVKMAPEDELHDLPDVVRHYDAGKKEQMCCDKTSAILSKMVKKYTELKYKETPRRAYKDCTPDKPSAKLAGVFVQDMQQGTPTSGILQWNASSSMSFTKGGVSYDRDNGYIRIMDDGYYYVFSQVKYADTNSEDVAYSGNLIHAIYYYSDKHVTEKKLAESSRSQCKINSQHSNSTNFMGAVFKLEANDKVYVKASHPHLLTACENGNFFGLYAV